jgi:hypothetical protein
MGTITENVLEARNPNVELQGVISNRSRIVARRRPPNSSLQTPPPDLARDAGSGRDQPQHERLAAGFTRDPAGTAAPAVDGPGADTHQEAARVCVNETLRLGGITIGNHNH